MMRKKHRDCAGSRRAGFTLIELLVVIAIIGVLFALIALFLVLGVTHTSFFGLFGG